MARGYSALADILSSTLDGVDLNHLWQEFQQTLTLRNQHQTALASLFAFQTTVKGEDVLQSFSSEDFEEASEYGVPTSMRNELTSLQVGYSMKWYDLARRMTWRFLSEAPAIQVSALHSAALAADNRLVFKTIMNRVFSPTAGVNEAGTPVYGFWSGDGKVPPDYESNTFVGTHNHYMTSGTATLDFGDVDSVVDTIEHHGFGLRQNGDRIIVMANPVEADIIAGFRVSGGATYDFIPATDAPAFILTGETIQGSRPPGEFNGLTVKGSYGDAWIVVDDKIPVGYIVGLSTGGPNSQRNPLGMRVHEKQNLRGLLMIPGSTSQFPLIDSYYVHALGIGTRLRGAGAVLQVTTGSYTAPTF